MTITSARLGRATLLTVTAGALALAASGCSLLGDGGRSEAGDRPPTSASGLGQAEQPAADAGDVGGVDTKDADGGQAGGSNGGGTSGGGTSGGGKGTTGGGNHNGDGGGYADSGPKIVYFRVKQRPTCPQGTNLYPVPGKPLVIEWKVTGAHKVELSVDGPGVYGSYEPSGTESFTFSCGGSPGTVEKHMYMLTTVSGGAERTKTVTATATVKEISDVGPNPDGTPAPTGP